MRIAAGAGQAEAETGNYIWLSRFDEHGGTQYAYPVPWIQDEKIVLSPLAPGICCLLHHGSRSP
jgi:hypothetical protein